MAKNRGLTTSKKDRRIESKGLIKSTLPEKIVLKPLKEDTALNGIQKVAALLIALGSDVAGFVLQHLDEDEIHLISKEIVNIKKVSPKLKKSIIKEFKELVDSEQFIVKGGINTAKNFILKVFDKEKADKLIVDINNKINKKPFQFLNKVEPEEIFRLLCNEHPQTIAFTLSYLSPKVSYRVLEELPHNIKVSVVKRIATLEEPISLVINETEKVLSKKLSTRSAYIPKVNGVNTIVEILNKLDRGLEKDILNAIEEESDDLAEEIKEKMFLFKDIKWLTNKEIRIAFELVNNKDLAMALKGESQYIKNLILSSISANRKKLIEQEIVLLGGVRYRDVYSAQKKIINLLKLLDSQGKIILRYSTSSDIIA